MIAENLEMLVWTGGAFSFGLPELKFQANTSNLDSTLSYKEPMKIVEVKILITKYIVPIRKPINGKQKQNCSLWPCVSQR